MAFPVNVDSTWANSGASYDAGELRRADSALFAGAGAALGVSGGIVRHGDTSLAVTIDASDNVTIQAGAVVIPGNAVAGTGCYRSALASATTNALAARSAVNPRIDLIVFRQLDTDVVGAHAAYTGRIDVIAGTPSATPSAPALPSMAVELARISVPIAGGGTATVDSSFRTYAGAIGGEIVVSTAARLPAAAATGALAYVLDVGLSCRFNGSTWDGLWRTIGGAGEPAFQNSWGTATSGDAHPAPSFRKDPSGVVHVRGALAGGASGTTAFTLPTGYRPSVIYQTLNGHGGSTGPQICQFNVFSTGAVTPYLVAGSAPGTFGYYASFSFST